MLSVYHNGFISKVLGLSRFYFLRLFYGMRFSSMGPCLVGANCSFVIKKTGKVIFGSNNVISNNVQMYSAGKVLLGDRVNVSEYSRIIAHDQISIGSNVTIAKFVTILDHDHAYKMEYRQLTLRGYDVSPVHIGNNVWIGDKSTVLKGVTIGDNVIVGAHTLVNKDIPSNTMVAGTPFKVIKTFTQ